MAELRRLNTGHWDLRFPADFMRETPGDFWSLLFLRDLKKGCISCVSTEKDNFETLETFPPKWKGISDGLSCYFYSLCTTVKVRPKQNKTKKNVGLHLLFATFATLARKSDRVDMSGQRIHRTILLKYTNTVLFVCRKPVSVFLIK